jgi:thiol-disulfide isomerase/thioredoxin
MNAQKKTLIGLLIFAAFLGIAYFSYQALAANIKPVSTSDPKSTITQSTKKTAAPDFTVFDAQGNKVKLSDFKGKPVVLNFWASWCPPCKSEMPHFNAAYADVKDTVVFMMVDLVDGQRETQATGQSYVKEQGFTFPVYFDNQQLAARAYGIQSIPTTVLIDANGYIVTGYTGAIDEQTLRAGIQLLTNGK